MDIYSDQYNPDGTPKLISNMLPPEQVPPPPPQVDMPAMAPPRNMSPMVLQPPSEQLSVRNTGPVLPAGIKNVYGGFGRMGGEARGRAEDLEPTLDSAYTDADREMRTLRSDVDQYRSAAGTTNDLIPRVAEETYAKTMGQAKAQREQQILFNLAQSRAEDNIKKLQTSSIYATAPESVVATLHENRKSLDALTPKAEEARALLRSGVKDPNAIQTLTAYENQKNALERQEMDMQQYKSVDPGRVWKKSTGASIMAIIASAIGGATSAVLKTPNTVIQALNKVIDDDIQAQQQAFDRGDKALIAARMGYVDAAKAYDDKQSRWLGTYLLENQAAQCKIQDYMMLTNNKEHQASMQGMLLGLQNEYANKLQTLTDKDRTIQMQALQGQGEMAQTMASFELASQKQGEEQSPVIGGVTFTAPTNKAGFERVQKLVEEGGIVENAFDELIEMRSGSGRWEGLGSWQSGLNMTERGRNAIAYAKRLASDILISNKKTAEFGAALTANEEEMLRALSVEKDPTRIGWILGQLQDARKYYTQSLDKRLDVYNAKRKGRPEDLTDKYKTRGTAD